MKSHNDFIVHIPQKHNDRFTTESGTKIFLDSRFSEKTTANNVFEVVETPVTYNGPIKPGCVLLVDPVVVHSQDYNKWGEEQNQFLVDADKNLYKVNSSLIICYSFGWGMEFKGFEDNLICQKHKQEKENQEKIGSIYIPDSAKEKTKDSPVLKVIIDNDELNSESVYKEDLIYYRPFGAVPINLRGNELIWLRNRYVLGKKIA